jgi:hypothetical protein
MQTSDKQTKYSYALRKRAFQCYQSLTPFVILATRKVLVVTVIPSVRPRTFLTYRDHAFQDGVYYSSRTTKSDDSVTQEMLV